MTPPRFAAALSEHPVASHAVGEVAGEIMERFGGDEPDLVVCFASPHFVGAMEDLAFALGNLLEPRVMLGATTVAVVGGPREVEDGPALSVFAASLPGRPAHAGRVRRRADPRRRRDHGLARSRPRPVEPASSSPTRSASRSTASSAG